MKHIMKAYESCKIAITVTYFGFVLIAIGFFITNPSFNLFYTVKSNTVLFIAELFLKIGELIILNLPLIFMLNYVCKKANNASVIVMALIGYFTFLTTTMLFSPQSLGKLAYVNSYGINSVFNMSLGNRYPLETGMIGSLLIGLLTRFSFVLSRHRSSFSITNIFSQEIAGIIYNISFCFILGVIVSYAIPFAYNFLQMIINIISEDLLDPFRIALYSITDRIMSIAGLGNMIRYPFWYTSLGGSFSNSLTGQSILGDVNIWSYVKDANSSYLGAGRFITVYYVINMFVIPGLYLGALLSMSDKKQRLSSIFTFTLGIILSIVAGNPLPVEILMLFTAPSLLIIYLIIVGIVSGLLVNFEAFLGFSSNISNTIVAMPGSFADYIINLRNPELNSTLSTIAYIGVIALIITTLLTLFYYRYLAFNFVDTGKGNILVNDIVEAVGGINNIKSAGSGLLSLNLILDNPEAIDFDMVQEFNAIKIMETRQGISFELGTSANGIARKINTLLKSNRD